MNFVLALICLVAAIGLFGYQTVTGDRRHLIPGTHFSLGWLLLIMAGYNLVRWWSVRAFRISREADRAATAERVRQRYRSYSEDTKVPDPTFDFTNQPPAGPPPAREEGIQPAPSPQERNENGANPEHG